MDAFQRKGLRQILHITTTYVDRTHTNDYVYREANRRANPAGTKHKLCIRPLSDLYNQRRQRLLYTILRLPDSDPDRGLTINLSTSQSPTCLLPRRVGRPKQNWLQYTMPLLWHTLHSCNANPPGPRKRDGHRPKLCRDSIIPRFSLLRKM